MKSLAVMFLLFSLAGNAQEIDGIGVIELGKTETQILSDLKIEAKKIVDGNTKTMKAIGKSSSKSVIRIKYDPICKLIKDMLSESSNFDLSLKNWGIEKCADATLLLIPKYEVAGVTVQHLRLTFYRDTLIRILYQNENDDNKNFLFAF
jgi:hypothetical protein